MSFQMFKLVLEKAEEPEIKLPTSAGLSKKQESSRKTSISALLTRPKPLTLDHNKLWKILKEMGIPDQLTCLLRNLYAGQETTVRIGHGATNWFQIGKGAHQGCQKNKIMASSPISSVQFSSVTQLCPTLCDPMNHSTPVLPVHHKLPEFSQTHAHRVSDAIQPSHPLSSPSPPAPNPSQNQGLFQ